MGVLSGKSEGADAILEVTAVVFAVAPGRGFFRITTEGFQRGSHFLHHSLAEGAVAVGVGIQEVHVFPVRVILGDNVSPGPFR